MTNSLFQLAFFLNFLRQNYKYVLIFCIYFILRCQILKTKIENDKNLEDGSDGWRDSLKIALHFHGFGLKIVQLLF